MPFEGFAAAHCLDTRRRVATARTAVKKKTKKRGKNKPKIGSIKVVAERICKCENSIRINSF